MKWLVEFKGPNGLCWEVPFTADTQKEAFNLAVLFGAARQPRYEFAITRIGQIPNGLGFSDVSWRVKGLAQPI